MSSDKTKATNDTSKEYKDDSQLITSDKEESAPPTFEGSGSKYLLQFNGYYKLTNKATNNTFVNVQNRRFYQGTNKGAKKVRDEFYVSYSRKTTNGVNCRYVLKGDVTYDKTKNIATLTFKEGELLFWRSQHSMVFGSNENGCVLTYVSGEIDKEPVSGVNYLNFIPLHSFAGTYPFAAQINGTKFKQQPKMQITKDNAWFYREPDDSKSEEQVQVSFNYYSSMFTLSNDKNPKESGAVMIFLGAGKSGLLAYMVTNIDSENYNFLFWNLKAIENEKSDKAIVSQQAAHVLAPFTGYYNLEKLNCFFSIYTTIKYSKSNPSGEYEVTLTYCKDGKNVINITNPTVFAHHNGHLTVQWRPEFATDLVQIELERNEKYDTKTAVLTTLKSPGFLGIGINTTNITPLSYFAAVYQYPKKLPGAKTVPPNVPILEITSDEEVFITSDGKKQQITEFTYSGAMYLLAFTVDIFVQFSFMLGVGPNGLCAYGIKMTPKLGPKWHLENETMLFFVYAIK